MRNVEENFLPATVEMCLEEIEDLQSRIDDISAQISLHDDGLISTDNQTWRPRAVKAMVHSKRSIQELERHIVFLGGKINADDVTGLEYVELKEKIRLLEGALRDSEKLLSDARASLVSGQNKIKERIALIQLAVCRQNHSNAKLKKYIEENAPELLPGAHACQTLAQAEFDAKFKQGERA